MLFIITANILHFYLHFLSKIKKSIQWQVENLYGVIKIKGFSYLCYQITKDNDSKYISNVFYDIQKEQEYKNIIVFVDDINRINLDAFCVGTNKILVIKDDEKEKEYLKYVHSINWFKIARDTINKSLELSEYNFCDFTDNKNYYVSYFYFLDTEKINRIRNFTIENKNKQATIICNSSIKDILQDEIPKATIVPIDIENFIEKEKRIYD